MSVPPLMSTEMGQGTPTGWGDPPGAKRLLFPQLHGALSPPPKKRAQRWHGAWSRGRGWRLPRRGLTWPSCTVARGHDLAPRTASPEPAAPRGKQLVPVLAPASPKIQLNGMGLSANLSSCIQPRRSQRPHTAGCPCAAFDVCSRRGRRKLAPDDSPRMPQAPAQPWHEGPPACAAEAGVPSRHPPPQGCPFGAAACNRSLQPRASLEQFSQTRAIRVVGKWKVFVRELQWQRGKALR